MNRQASLPASLSGAALLNRDCHGVSLDRGALNALLAARDPAGLAMRSLRDESRNHLFADRAVFVDEADMERMASLVAAIEKVVRLPSYRQAVLKWTPEASCRIPECTGVFLGYDFHLGEEGPRLIEINTNAGGALLNAVLGHAHRGECLPPPGGDDHSIEDAFLAMFRQEWRSERGDAPLSFVAIVDEHPEAQFLYPEFLLFQELFRRAGIEAVLCDPGTLVFRAGALWWGDRRVDLVYNRLTDFALMGQDALREAFEAGAAVVTPHPHAHALHADKRNLILLSDPQQLESLGADPETIGRLVEGIPRTEAVIPENADSLWERRRQLFFKPACGFGSKAAYRGDKLTRRVFAEILAGDYVAQAYAPPGLRHASPGEGEPPFKVDLRHYVYRGDIQLSCARLYRGQTTNFRTPGGGFAPLVVVKGV